MCVCVCARSTCIHQCVPHSFLSFASCVKKLVHLTGDIVAVSWSAPQMNDLLSWRNIANDRLLHLKLHVDARVRRLNFFCLFGFSNWKDAIFPMALFFFSFFFLFLLNKWRSMAIHTKKCCSILVCVCYGCIWHSQRNRSECSNVCPFSCLSNDARCGHRSWKD